MDDKKIKIVTHSGGFHSDDVFAVATLLILNEGKEAEVVRSRDEKHLSGADYVVDTGSIYDPDKNLFDHHQKEGAGERKNGIPYASFGLVWKHFGEKVAGGQRIAEIIDEKLVQPIDAFDNGVDIIELTEENVYPYTIQGLKNALEPAWGESDRDVDRVFVEEAVPLAKKIIKREIVHAKSRLQAEEVVSEKYEEADDKRLVIFDEGHGWSRELLTFLLSEYKEPIYFIRPHEDGIWQVTCVLNDVSSFELRKPLPEEWAGLRGEEELAKVTGVEDATFCHRGRFMCVAGSKEGAIALAQKALER